MQINCCCAQKLSLIIILKIEIKKIIPLLFKSINGENIIKMQLRIISSRLFHITMCCITTTVKRSTNPDVTSGTVDLQVKLLSGSVPLELNNTKLTFVPATLSVIHCSNSETRA